MRSRVMQLRASPATFDGLMDADRQLGQDREPDLILAFLPSDGGLESTLAAMAEVWPTSRRLGCESASQFADTEIVYAGCLQFFWLDDEDHDVQVEAIQGTAEEPPDPSLIDAVCRNLAGSDFLLVLADGERFPVQQLLGELHRHRAVLPATIAGGCASLSGSDGDDAGRVFQETTVYPSGCLLIGFEGVTGQVEMVQDFEPASPIYTVTRAEGHVVHEIDGVSAVDWYRRFFTVRGRLAPMPRTALGFPLILSGPHPDDPAARQGVCRGLRTFDEPQGAVTYWGDVCEGDEVRLGMGFEASLVKSAHRRQKAEKPEAALLLSFADREALLGEDAPDEIAELAEVLGGVALGGSVTSGEIVFLEDGPPVLQNQTAVLVLLREKDR